jgi:hypothetical protein
VPFLICGVIERRLVLGDRRRGDEREGQGQRSAVAHCIGSGVSVRERFGGIAWQTYRRSRIVSSDRDAGRHDGERAGGTSA